MFRASDLGPRGEEGECYGCGVGIWCVGVPRGGGGGDMLEARNWVVGGDVLNGNKAASECVETLRKGGKRVHLVDPRSPAGSGTTGSCPGTFTDIASVTGSVDAVNLCINPRLGIELVKQAKERGVKNVFVQPGAGSREIEEFARENGMVLRAGCVIVEMTGEHFNPPT